MSQYIFVRTKQEITWEAAAQAAQNRGAQLASINTTEEDAFVRSVLATYDRLWTQEPLQDALNGPWIGLFQSLPATEPAGGWTWLDGTQLTLNGWHPSQPDNFIGDRYGHYWTYQGVVGWSDHINQPTSAGYGPIKSYGLELGDAVVALTGSKADEFFFGGDVANVVRGGGGGDVIDGRLGADTLTGGGGRDRFVFQSAAGADGDRITDAESGDKIDLSGIDANEKRDGDQRFSLVAELTGRAGQLSVTFDGAISTLAADTDGDGLADFVVTASGDLTTFTGFVL